MSSRTESIIPGQPCERCNKPMTRRLAAKQDGHVQHESAGYCQACVRALHRDVVRRQNIPDDDGLIDAVSVERAVSGDRNTPCSRAELAVAVGYLAKLEHSPLRIAHTIGMPVRFVQGVLDDSREAAA